MVIGHRVLKLKADYISHSPEKAGMQNIEQGISIYEVISLQSSGFDIHYSIFYFC
jgi:hypothetical protein